MDLAVSVPLQAFCIEVIRREGDERGLLLVHVEILHYSRGQEVYPRLARGGGSDPTVFNDEQRAAQTSGFGPDADLMPVHVVVDPRLA